MNQALVQDVVAEVMRRLSTPSSRSSSRAGEDAPANEPSFAPPHSISDPTGQFGIFNTVDEAVIAATEAQKKLAKLSLDDRDAIVKLIKSMAKQNAQAWGQMEYDETKIGRLDHKIEKLQILELVPGVEFLKTNAISGSNGLCLEEYAPFGVIGIITPVTHSVPTLGANAVNMIASGNSIVANPHPSGTRSAVHAVREWNKAISAKYGVEHLITVIAKPTLETAEQLFHHRGISLLVVTGGPAVARAALKASKRAIVAGPGNPPVVVDETACLDNAATSIIKGAAYDNNLLCIGEKQVFAVESIFDKLLQKMQQNGAYLLNAQQIEALTKAAFTFDKEGHPHVNKDLVGKDPAVLAKAIGLQIPPTVQLLIGQTNFDHAFVQEEQMMPFVPLVRVKNVEEAIDLAIKSEHGYRHTAIIHSRNMDTVTKFGRRANTTLFVVNGASPAGLGLGGQGHLSYSIATPTGEGITTPLTFTRYRRIMITNSLRMI
ncbi:MAG TPA: aldehyde dehydrogenase family protein [Tepidisphaeraceae bacterium]|jgi:aldehyde dehydrogenase|nr:aldehyde dehydrogenase family protein [Tepidisphaeraceae bacterium]